MAIQGKKILICVTGGIAAYKINYLIRDLVKKGAELQVLMTPSAEKFVSKLTLSTLSKKPVFSDFYSENGTWNNHVEFALWADLILIAPCTANTLAKMVHGICDNLVIATYMSAKCPVMIAPAMDLDMYEHPSTKQNLELAEDFGHIIIPAETGELASGLVGQGRMAEPEKISKTIEDFFTSNTISLRGCCCKQICANKDNKRSGLIICACSSTNTNRSPSPSKAMPRSAFSKRMAACKSVKCSACEGSGA